MSTPEADGDPTSSEFAAQEAGSQVDRRTDRVESGEFDVIGLFYPVAEAISPAFVANQTDSAEYGGAVSLKNGYEIRPGEFVPVGLTFRVELNRDFMRIDDGEPDEPEDNGPTTDGAEIDEGDFDGDEGGGLSILEIDDDADEIPNAFLTTLACIEERTHQIAELPLAWMRMAEQKGYLREDGNNVFHLHQTTRYIIFLSDGDIQRDIICQYNVNGHALEIGIDIDGVVGNDVIQITELKDPLDDSIGGEGSADLSDLEVEVSTNGEVVDFATEAAQFMSLAALSRQFATSKRVTEYAGEAAKIIWQVLNIPVPGFTDEQAPNRL